MIKEYLDDYYLLKISLKEICEKEGINQSTFYRYLEDNNLPARRLVYARIDLDDHELNKKMKDKYASIVKRCNGRHSNGNYDGKEYMSIFKWVEFCNENKNLLLKMWNNYIKSGRDPKKSISIDRIDNSKGYVEGNIEFVTHGYNAWKRNIRPIKALFKNRSYFFMSCEEASRYFGIRRQCIGECLQKTKHRNKNYDVELATLGDVLNLNKCIDIKTYYEKVFLQRLVN